VYFSEKPLRDDTGAKLYKYRYYLRLKTHSAWKVPAPFGRLPHCPDETSTTKEKANYALYMMLLFRPHRLLESLVLNIWHGAAVRGSEAAAQLAVYDVFVQWRADIDQQAAAAFSKARLAFPEGSQRKPRQPFLPRP